MNNDCYTAGEVRWHGHLREVPRPSTTALSCVMVVAATATNIDNCVAQAR